MFGTVLSIVTLVFYPTRRYQKSRSVNTVPGRDSS
jgi:hypothetical protein